MKFLNGIVSHSRVGDQKHAFDYGYKSLLVEDIFDFETNLFKSISSRFFWYDKNFTDCSQSIINEFQTFLKMHQINVDDVQVNLLRTPNIFFLRSFNPVCFWFLLHNDQCIYLVPEVKNTFYEDQTYFVHNAGNPLQSDQWLEVRKKMYVSPFAEKSGFYKFRVSLNPFTIRINQFNPKKKAEIVTNIRGEFQTIGAFQKPQIYLRLLISSRLVLFRIHLQALFLWLKKFKVFAHEGDGYADKGS